MRPTPRLFSIALLVLLASCSREEPSAARPPITPAIDPAQKPQLTDKRRILSAEFDAAGVAASYDAHFTDGRVTRITEKRARPPAGFASGEYEYRGARLVRYAGAPMAGDGALGLELDMQGRVVEARIDGRPALPEEISAIRSRAQLLRSHALALSAARAHVAQ